MTDPAKTVDQNILPVQAYFNLDGSFNTFIGQGQPFVISATESISITNSTVNATLYPTFTSSTGGQVTGLGIASSSLTWNPGTGVFSAPTFFGTLNGTANTANNLSGGGAGQIVYQNALGSTTYLPAGSTGQFLLSNGTSAPSWATVATSVTIADQTTDSATYYPLFYSATSGSTNTVETSSTKLQYQPSTGKFTATLFSGSGASLTNIPNGALTNSSVTIGSTSIALGGTSTTLSGLTSVTATTFTGSLVGNSSTATTATNATNSAITDNTSSSATWYPTLVASTSGNQALTSSSTKLSFQPSTSTLTASIFSGAATNIYGGTTNQIAVQSAANTTTFIVAPTVASTVLNWTGSAFSWVASGSVTSVAATVPSFLSITGSPITTSGTLAISYSGTALPGANGGTGQTGAFVAGGIVYGSSTTALAVTAIGTTGQALLSNGASAPTWGTLGVGAGGTGVTTSTGIGSLVLNTSPTLTTPAITGGTISNLTQELIGQSYDQGTGVLQVTGQSTFNGAVTDKSLNLQGGNNLLTYSQAFDNAAWSKANTTITTGANIAPDGTQTMSKLVEDATTNYHTVQYTYALTAGTFTFSIFAKQGERKRIMIRELTTSGNGAIFDLSTGTVVNNLASGIGSIILVGNGVYRCSVVGTETTGTRIYGVYLATDTTTTVVQANYTGNGTSGIYIWGAQLELGTIASAYTPTTTAAITTTNNISVPSGQVGIGTSSPTANFSLDARINVNAQAGIKVVNSNTGSSAWSATSYDNGTNVAQFGIAGSSYGGYGAIVANSAFIYSGGGNRFAFAADGASGAISFATGGGTPERVRVDSSGNLNIVSGTLGFGSASAPDVILARDAANTLAQRNSTNAQTSRLYNTYTDASNYERHSHTWSSNVLYAKNENAGTGSARLYIPVTGATTVASLPSASTAGVGARSFVTDALAPSFGVAVSGGGAVKIPVYSDGTSWYVG